MKEEKECNHVFNDIGVCISCRIHEDDTHAESRKGDGQGLGAKVMDGCIPKTGVVGSEWSSSKNSLHEGVKPNGIKIWTAYDIWLLRFSDTLKEVAPDKQFIEVEELKKVILELKDLDVYHRIGKVRVWKMNNDGVCDKTQEYIVEFLCSKLGLEKVKR